MGDLVNVEAIPLDVMRRGIGWEWESFGEYMDALSRRPLGINVAPLVPLTPLRHYVLGEASFDRAATAVETVTLGRLYGEALDAGAFGLSTTILQNHVGDQGRPLACRLASPTSCARCAARCAGVAEASSRPPSLPYPIASPTTNTRR
jgi:N-acyl-D-aspartate/D-glutamate deacylase